ncbi:MAG: hypothetical protein F4121_09335 [Acidimicrobiia bacterium]|nr:hypothetical protein [Acidimicrobiia bacterium]MYC45464.1 hypothetical protein [Acidimicrobiia bacterium]MYI20250.1 hypothetical protein [Acidimicrobiia bacterium]
MLKRLVVVLAVSAGAALAPAGVSGQETEKPDFTIGEVNFLRISDECAPETRTYQSPIPECPGMYETRMYTFTGRTGGRHWYRDRTLCVGSLHAFWDVATGHSWLVPPGRYQVWADDGGWGGHFERVGDEQI